MRELSPVVERAILALLAEYVGAPAEPEARERARADRSDLLVRADGHTFVVAYKTRGDVASVARAINVLETHAGGRQAKRPWRPGFVPLVVVPSMGRVGRDACERAGVSWLDLNGNARITAPGLRIWVEGKADRVVTPPAPRFNPFAPKASRIPRVLLLDPTRWWMQSELVEQTGLDKGLVSNVVCQLTRDGHLARDSAGKRVRPREPALLLDVWREVYDFDKHDLVYGAVAARSGPDLLRRLSGALKPTPIRFAATGLAGAFLLAPFADFRNVTLYVDDLPGEDVRATLGFREGKRGSNVWLTVPNDAGVFDGGTTVDGIPCVSAVQCYLDLGAQPERAADAAHELRAARLGWASPLTRGGAAPGLPAMS